MNPKQEAEVLVNELLPLAKRMLSEFGEFYPYGGYMKLNGEIVHVGARDPKTAHPKSKDLIRILKRSFSEIAKNGQAKAIAIVFDVRISLPNSGDKTDAIQVNVEHAGNYAAEIFFPYRVANKEVIFGKTLAQEGEYEFFGHGKS